MLVLYSKFNNITIDLKNKSLLLISKVEYSIKL